MDVLLLCLGIFVGGIFAAVLLGLTEKGLCHKGRDTVIPWGIFLPVIFILFDFYSVGACFEMWPFFGYYKLVGWGSFLWPLEILVISVPIWIATVGVLIGAIMGFVKKE